MQKNMEKINISAIEFPSVVIVEVMEMGEETDCFKNKWDVQVPMLGMIFHNKSFIVRCLG